jgi:hypothetical protein
MRPGRLSACRHQQRQAYFSRDLIAGLLDRATGLKLNDEELGTVSGC